MFFVSQERSEVNAFSVMINAQRQLARKCLPDMVEYPRTNKERLRNDVIKFLMEKQFQWRAAEFSSLAAASYKHWLIASGQLLAIMMSSTNKALPIPLLLENCPDLKTDVENVAQALANYASYLQKSCKKTYSAQSDMYSTSPVRQLSDNLTFQFLLVCSANTSSSLIVNCVNVSMSAVTMSTFK